MRFNCTNCNKIYEIDPTLVQGNAVMFTCRKCQQQMVIRKSEATGEMVVATGRPGARVRSTTQEISRVTKGGVAVVTSPHAIKKDNAAVWYVTALGRRQGPLTDQGLLELMVADKISPSTYAWRKSMPEWVRLKDLPEMGGLIAEAIRQNPEIATRMAEKSSLSSVKTKNGKSGSLELKDTEAEYRATQSRSLADDLYTGLTDGGIDPRNASIMQYEVSGGDEYQEDRDQSRTPTVRDMPKAGWADERPGWDRETSPGLKSTGPRRRDTAPLNIAALNRSRRNRRIVIGASIGAVAVAIVVSIVLIVADSGSREAGRAAPAARIARPHGNSVPVPAPAAPVPAPAAPVRADYIRPAPDPVSPAPAPAPAVPAADPVRPAAPTPSAGTVTVINSGSFGQTELKGYVLSQVPRLSGCRAKLNRQTDASINFNLSFVLTTAGRTDKVLARPVGTDEPRVAECVQDIVKSWEFDPRSSPLPYFGIIGI